MNKKIFCIVWAGLLLFGGGVSAIEVDPIHLVFENSKITLDFDRQPQLLQTEHQHYLVIGNTRMPVDLEGTLVAKENPFFGSIETEFQSKLSVEGFMSFLEASGILAAGNVESVKIHKDESGKFYFDGVPQSGFKTDYPKLINLLNNALIKGEKYVRVPGEKQFSRIAVSPELEEKGVREVVAQGESNFRGSSNARRQNIRVAADRFSGVLIPKGETFSFNEILKDVEEEDGFVKELVIKGNKTEKELGGGVCQVSTTVYRAALNGGFPITSRRNHSYAVPYYKPYGLDATIYIGVQDFEFTNDTPGDVLLQAYMEGDNLHFILYGTKDDRTVMLEGPVISNYKKAPPPIVLETEDLLPGKTEVVSTAHDGFTTQWVRKVEKNGEIKTDTISSYYRPWPAQILKGKVETEESLVQADRNVINPIRRIRKIGNPSQNDLSNLVN